jgi:hypothetical protein
LPSLVDARLASSRHRRKRRVTATGGVGAWRLVHGSGLAGRDVVAFPLRSARWITAASILLGSCSAPPGTGANEGPRRASTRPQAVRTPDSADPVDPVLSVDPAAERDWVERACQGLTDEERRRSPFSRDGGVVAIAPMFAGEQLVGARATFRRGPAGDPARIERAIVCHYSQAAAAGNRRYFMPRCPAAVAPLTITLTERPEELVVSLRGWDPVAAADVWARLQAAAAEKR